MILTPKGQGLRLSTDGMQARLTQQPRGDDVALFLHTSGMITSLCSRHLHCLPPVFTK